MISFHFLILILKLFFNLFILEWKLINFQCIWHSIYPSKNTLLFNALTLPSVKNIFWWWIDKSVNKVVNKKLWIRVLGIEAWLYIQVRAFRHITHEIYKNLWNCIYEKCCMPNDKLPSNFIDSCLLYFVV